MKSAWSIVVPILAAAGLAMANPVAIPSMDPVNGGSPAVEAIVTPVAMDKERVNISLGLGEARVKGVYWLRNTSDDPVEVTIAFPADSEYMGFDTGRESAAFRYFRVTVDEKPIEDPGYERLSRPRNHGSLEGVRKYYHWEIAFGPGQTRKIVVRYEHSTLFFGDTNEEQLFEYLLRTGYSWCGPIQDAVISITFRGRAVWRDFDAYPPGYSERWNTISWSYSNFEPLERHDVRVRYGTRTINRSEKSDIGHYVAIITTPRGYSAAALVVGSGVWLLTKSRLWRRRKAKSVTRTVS